MPVKSNYINSLYQDNNGLLYIGTDSSGLLIYDPEINDFTRYYTVNSSLISDNICTILGDEEGKYIVIGTELGLTRFYPSIKFFVTGPKIRD